MPEAAIALAVELYRLLKAELEMEIKQVFFKKPIVKLTAIIVFAILIGILLGYAKGYASAYASAYESALITQYVLSK